jgi:hypothetical protein
MKLSLVFHKAIQGGINKNKQKEKKKSKVQHEFGRINVTEKDVERARREINIKVDFMFFLLYFRFVKLL